MSKTICKVMGFVLIISAVAGFVGGTHVLVFQVNNAQNIVHLLSGIVALYFGMQNEQTSRTCAAAFAAIYGIFGLLGIAGAGPVIECFGLNAADNWSHLATGAIFFIAAFGEQLGIKRYFMGGQTQLPPGGRLQS